MDFPFLCMTRAEAEQILAEAQAEQQNGQA